MDTPASTSTQQSSGNEKTPDSGTPRIRRAYMKSCHSPTLQAFISFDESLGQFWIHFKKTIESIGTEDVYVLATQLHRLDKKCESMQEDFKRFISNLDKAIENYEKKKPTNLAADANIIISAEEQTANRSPLFKDTKTIDEISAALIISIGNICTAIQKKITKSIYNDQYSISLEKKLKNLKKMCEDNSEILEEYGNEIKKAIKENNDVMQGIQQMAQLQQQQQP